MNVTPCCCDQSTALEACCGAYLSGARLPPTALALLRSRYAAYVKGEVDYVIASTAAIARPTLDRPELVAYCRGLMGIRLKIIGTQDGGKDDEVGFVEFRANLRVRGKSVIRAENSRFEREDGRWVYVPVPDAGASPR